MKAFVIFRDRVTYAKECVEALYAGGIEDVIVINQGSTYPPAVDWLHLDLDIKVQNMANLHPRHLWETDHIQHYVGTSERYVVTDCDVVPGAPTLNWIPEFEDILERNPDRCKVGWSLRITCIPETYQHQQKVIDWERQHWEHPLEKPEAHKTTLFGAAVDTTLAMYQPLDMYPSFALGPAIRAGFPYYARHLSWYEDSSDPSEEQVYYEAHMNRDYSHWIAPERYS